MSEQPDRRAPSHTSLVAALSLAFMLLVQFAVTVYTAGRIVEKVDTLQISVADIRLTVKGMDADQGRLQSDVESIKATLRARGLDVPGNGAR